MNGEQLSKLLMASPKLRRSLEQAAAQAVRQYNPERINVGDARLQILPFEEPERSGLFDAANQTPLRFVARPQTRFRGERLVAVVARNADAAAAGVEMEASAFSVGAEPQTVSAGGGSIPLAAFEPQSVGVRLQLDDARPGIEIAATVQPVAPLTGQQAVVVRLLLLGTAIEE